MKRFIEGENRFQSTLFPESLEDYIADDHPLRSFRLCILLIRWHNVQGSPLINTRSTDLSLAKLQVRCMKTIE